MRDLDCSGVTTVVSPLIARMKDQVDGLQTQRGILADSIDPSRKCKDL